MRFVHVRADRPSAGAVALLVCFVVFYCAVVLGMEIQVRLLGLIIAGMLREAMVYIGGSTAVPDGEGRGGPRRGK